MEGPMGRGDVLLALYTCPILALYANGMAHGMADAMVDVSMFKT